MPLGCVLLYVLIYVVVLYKLKSIGIYLGACLHSYSSLAVLIAFSPPNGIMCSTGSCVSFEQQYTPSTDISSWHLFTERICKYEEEISVTD